MRLRPRHPRLGRRRRARTRDAVLGALVQREPAARALPRRPARGVRSSVLRCPTDRPRRGRNSIERASIRPRAVQRAGLPARADRTFLAALTDRADRTGRALLALVTGL